ncbi:type II toxin-antitoxin system RelB/DinJ family antitoxin [Paraburkholderia sp. A2WS-5]|uniref:type II toxin-antitoxin system RelB/DinJ family antitoxin n=1 Tax=unclassified Paraburkholderia TaxID=2615204 RepID=UPI003B77CF52
MSRRYSEVVAAIDPALKANAYEVLAEMNIPVSDFLRSAIIHLIEKREVPFDIKKALPGRRTVRRAEQVPA